MTSSRSGDDQRVQYALVLAMICGLLFLVFWYFRLAFLSSFLSKAVLVGVVTGLGIGVLTNQSRKMLGASVEGVLEMEAFALQIKDTMASSIQVDELGALWRLRRSEF